MWKNLWKKARFWADLGAKKNDNDSLNVMGTFYHVGNGGVPKDYPKALDYFKKATAGGNASTLFSLGVMSVKGQGVPRNIEVAKQYFAQAVEKGPVNGLRAEARGQTIGNPIDEDDRVAAIEMLKLLDKRGDLESKKLLQVLSDKSLKKFP